MSSFFFFNDTATTEIYTLSLHDALPISQSKPAKTEVVQGTELSRVTLSPKAAERLDVKTTAMRDERSEEHTSELQSRLHLVCRLLLEKKKKIKINLDTET